jgi:glycerol 3-phosphatase-2
VKIIADSFDVALFDLDGVVYVGLAEVPHAAGAIAAAAIRGMRPVYVTNNASRPPEEVVEQLVGFGLAPTRDDVVTSAQIAAGLLAQRFPPGSAILAVGGRGLRTALVEVGLRPVDKFADAPLAVVQGFGPEVAWKSLAEASYAVHAGLPWLATNADLTVPTPQGIAPGNGALVNAVAAATGRYPEVSGKPEPIVFTAAAARVGAQRPLVVGDRLDTDIAGAVAAGYPSLLVLTGVTHLLQVAVAGCGERPTFVAPDLRALVEPLPKATGDLGDGGWIAGSWLARTDNSGVIELSLAATPSDGFEATAAIAALLACAWDFADRTSLVPDCAGAVSTVEAILATQR